MGLLLADATLAKVPLTVLSFLTLASVGEDARVGFLHVPYQSWPRGVRLWALTRAIEICAESLTASHPRFGGV